MITAAARLPVLLVDDETRWRGGQDSLFTLMDGLASTGYKFAVACPRGSELARRCGGKGWETYEIRRGWEISPRTTLAFASILRRRRPFAVVHNTPRTIFPARAAQCITRRRTGSVLFRRVDFPLKTNMFSKWKFGGLDAVVAISGAVRETLVRGGVRPERVEVIPECIDIAAFDGAVSGTPRALPGGTLVFFCLAALTREKGVDILVSAFARHASRHPSSLVVAGDGPEMPALREAVRRLEIDGKVRLLGFRDDFASLVCQAHAVVVPSRSEGFGRSALYAMAAGLPVIGSRTGGIPDAVVHGETGLLVPPEDVASLADAMDEFASMSEGARRAMGDSGRARVERSFPIRLGLEKTVALFDRIGGMLSGTPG